MLFSTFEQRTTEVNVISSKKLFDAIPVNPSVLRHIHSLGVGIKSKKKRKSSSSRISSKSDVLSLEEEVDYFLHKSNTHTTRNNRSRKPLDDENSSLNRYSYTPPPPFSVPIALGHSDLTTSNPSIKRLPVKILGKAGSISDEMPRASKGLPEVAIIGRSNVGKSTLLNALLYGNQFGDSLENRKMIRGKTPESVKVSKGVKAKVSNTPGETKEITFYQLSCQMESQKASLLLVDLPGYGFAYSSESKSSEWKELMKEYLLNRGKSLKRILFLIDSRHGMKKSDFDFLNMLQNGLREKEKETTIAPSYDTNISKTNRKRLELPPIQIVLTKGDLVSQVDLAKRVTQVKQQLSEALLREPSRLPVMVVSAKAGIGYNNIRDGRACGGILELQREIASLVSIKENLNR